MMTTSSGCASRVLIDGLGVSVVMKSFLPFARIISLCAASLALGGCSAIKLGYAQLPELTWWWIDAYIDVSDVQSPRLRHELQSLMTWHRAEELPRYVRLLQKMQTLAPGTLTAEQTCAVFDEVRQHYLALAARTQAPALWLAQSLDTAQVAHMARKFEKNNAEWRSEWLTGNHEENLSRREELAASRAELFYGLLDDAQRRAMRGELALPGYNPQLLWAERQRRQQDMLRTISLLAAQPPMQAEAARATLAALYTRLNTSPDPAYRNYSEASVRAGCASFARLHNQTTPSQRERAVQKLKRYEEDLQALMAKPG